MVVPLPRVPRRPGPGRRLLALAPGIPDVDGYPGGAPVPAARVRTCHRHRSYWLASCDTCRDARRLTLAPGALRAG